MKSLKDVLKESVQDDDIFMSWSSKQEKDAEDALKPLWNVWKASDNLYKVNHYTANQVAQKMISDLTKAGFVNYRDTSSKKIYPNHIKSLVSGNGLVLFSTDRTGKQVNCVSVYMITDRQYRYIARFTEEGIKVGAYKDPSRKPIVADAGVNYIFEIPGDISEKIFSNSGLNPY